ncbi:helix-turn-helix transcriptional regulator [Plantibacter sp. ME-Dv--P-095]|uniref:helix-turn-helix domain-containing protein n=1 Tax=Plantibacter sp. ME-Dv--P-095 TaxID=3040299 RepID=UPI00254D5D82|nr:helix-turn-helix transcriptional regulator [Plantibacter sp. ME-Dv--P-095]
MRRPNDPGQVVARDEQVDAEWADFAHRLAVRLRQLRSNAGLSQEDVAYRAGLARYTYQRYEKGESRAGVPSNPPLRSLLALARVLGVELAEMVPEPAPDLRVR